MLSKDDTSGTRFLFIVVLMMISNFIIGCKLSPTETQALSDAVGGSPDSPAVPDSQEPDIIEHDASCFEEQYFQPAAEITKKIDILFVTDTSGSLDQERAQIASEIDSFVNQLPLDVDYQIAVMAAHGSRGSGSGKLVKIKSEPYVLRSSEMTVDQIRADLVKKLTLVQGDRFSDGGEEGLYSLNRALEHGMLTANRAHGFFREDAGLAVVFIADENDICARYPQGVVPVADPDRLEKPAFERDCGSITPESVLGHLKEVQGSRPLLIGGILYNENSVIPKGGENEIGYGYLDLIRLANGISVDLSGSRFHEGLATIGSLVTKKLHLITEYQLKNDNIDTFNINVLVDGAKVPFNYLPDLNEVQLTEYAGVENSKVSINYCLKVESILDPPAPGEIPPAEPAPVDDGGSATDDSGNGGNGNTGSQQIDEDGDGYDDITHEVIL